MGGERERERQREREAEREAKQRERESVCLERNLHLLSVAGALF